MIRFKNKKFSSLVKSQFSILKSVFKTRKLGIKKTNDVGVKVKVLIALNLLLVICLWVVSSDKSPGQSQNIIDKMPYLSVYQPSKQKVRPVRVLLGNTKAMVISCINPDTSQKVDFFMQDSEHGTPKRIAADAKYRLARSKGKWYLLDGNNVDLLANNVVLKHVIKFEPSANGVLELAINDDNSNILEKETTKYRGILQIRSRGVDSFSAINHVDLEDYLLGVVGAEMPATWSFSALRSQCIAARTYVMYHMYVDPLSRYWDVKNTQASQVYGGLGREHKRVTRAVSDTSGVVLAYGARMAEKIFPTYFSSICGGHTQNAGPVFGQKLQPLSGRKCFYCTQNAPKSRLYWPDIVLSVREISNLLVKRDKQLAALGEIISIRIAAVSSYGRVERMELIGRGGKRVLIRGEDFRLAITRKEKPLLSSWFTIIDRGGSYQFHQGRGWGHGVGMCQYGCRKMSDIGKNCTEILSFYYPSSTLVKVF